MMDLKLQIITFSFSLIYGFFFAFLIVVFKKYLFYTKKCSKIIFNLLFSITNTLLYFFILKYINNAIVHYYLFIAIVIGFILFHYLRKVIEKHFKK